MKVISNLLEELSDILHKDAISFDGLEEAIIGYGSKFPEENVLVYSADKIIDVLMEKHNISHGEAIEYFDFNIAGLRIGQGTPIIVWKLNED